MDLVIKRYIDPQLFDCIKNNFLFLSEAIKNSYYEYDLQIRENYFNLYYKGNSLAKITILSKDKYSVSIHEKFFNSTKASTDTRFINFIKKSGQYFQIDLTGNLLHPFFQQKYISEFASRINQINFQEEIIFEQMIMTDNIANEDFLIIDRQIVDNTDKTKMDLLALKKNYNNNYYFFILEVKLGNNPELQSDVSNQLNHYIKKIHDNFDDYKKCYELNYSQKYNLKLFDSYKFKTINILPGVSGAVIVGGYSKIANEKILKLRSIDPNIKIIQFTNKLDKLMVN